VIESVREFKAQPGKSIVTDGVRKIGEGRNGSAKKKPHTGTM